MEHPLVDDVKAMMRLVGRSPYTMRAGLSYATMLVDEFRNLGVDLPQPKVGGTVELELATGEKLTIEVH